MTDADQLKLLKNGVAEWNRWRAENRRAKVDLSVAGLVEANLKGADLVGANLSGTNLSRADLSHAEISDSDLSLANLRGANLSRANLRGANLSKADLSQSVDLRWANVSLADLSRASLKGADLSHATLAESNLSQADLSEADLSEANLKRTNFMRAILSRANLTGASLSHASLVEANLSQADLSEADLSGVRFLRTIFGGTQLGNAQGLDACKHLGPSILDHQTLENSGMLIPVFLQGCGLPNLLIDYLPSILGDAIAFYSCFISYSHADKIFARRLHDQLQGQGIRCWLDEHQMLPGDDIYEQVERGIKQWDKVLLCCSEESLTSWWVDNEIDTAFEKERRLTKERKEKVLSLIPLDLDGYLFGDQCKSGKARAIKSRFTADFKGWQKDNDKFERAFQGVVKALKTGNKGREIAPTPKL